MLTAKEISSIKERLPKGYFKKIMEKITVSEKTLSNFFTGEVYRLDIHNAALDVIEDHKENIEKTIARHKSILKEKAS